MRDTVIYLLHGWMLGNSHSKYPSYNVPTGTKNWIENDASEYLSMTKDIKRRLIRPPALATDCWRP